ncbi:MAG TPA: hypothetical protein VFV47_13975 [Hyphomicrobiaceae bacterium]|nr:hypothetical protein [Hyphomicrobiaceae bacterium]
MSITREDFERSLALFAPGVQLDADGRAVVATDSGSARLLFEGLGKRRLGGLLSMPQARITLDLSGLPEPEREPFLRRFDIAFQRGGG